MNNLMKWLTTLLTPCIVFIFLPLFAHAADEQYNNVMVVYKNDSGKEQVFNQASKIEHTYENLHTIEGTFTKEAVDALKKVPDIQVVEKNPTTVEITNTTSPLLTTITPNWNIQAINAQKAWSSGITGKNVKVAVVDTGVSMNPSLPNVERYSFVDDDPKTTSIDESSPYDTEGHGTFVSGIIAAGVTSSQLYGNIVGVAPDVSLYSLKVFEKDGASMESLLKALEWSIENNIDIVNMSLGTTDDDPILKNAVKIAYDTGLTLVAAAGNDGVGKDVEYPAKYDEVIAVSSLDQSNQISYFSNTGSKVEFSAPGSDVYSLGIYDEFREDSGTSFSTPHVTGFLALLKQQYPDYTNKQLRKVLQNYTMDLGEKGRDPYYGYGLVNYVQTTPDGTSSAISASKPRYFTTNPGTVATKVQVNQYSSTSFTSVTKGKVVAKNTLVKVAGIVKTSAGTPRLKLTNGTYMTANLDYIVKVTSKIDQYYTKKPSKILVKSGLYAYNNADLDSRMTGVKKNTVLSIKDLAYSSGGVPRLKLSNGYYITASKDFVRAVTSSIADYIYVNPGKVQLKRSVYQYSSSNMSSTTRKSALPKGKTYTVKSISFSSGGTPRLKLSNGNYITANKNYVVAK